jgi:hypothetical protein
MYFVDYPAEINNTNQDIQKQYANSPFPGLSFFQPGSQVDDQQNRQDRQ